MSELNLRILWSVGWCRQDISDLWLLCCTFRLLLKRIGGQEI